MLSAVAVVAVVLGAVALLMLAELQLSLGHERMLRADGASEPPDDVYPLMRLAYPGAFAAMAIEPLARGTVARDWLLLGVVLLGCAKALKFWAIASLGRYWSFRVLVIPGAPLVRTGPYRYVRHPNYVALIAEFVAVAIALQAPGAGALAVVGFGILLRRRIAVEERALGLRAPAAQRGPGLPPGR